MGAAVNRGVSDWAFALLPDLRESFVWPDWTLLTNSETGHDVLVPAHWVDVGSAERLSCFAKYPGLSDD